MCLAIHVFDIEGWAGAPCEEKSRQAGFASMKKIRCCGLCEKSRHLTQQVPTFFSIE